MEHTDNLLETEEQKGRDEQAKRERIKELGDIRKVLSNPEGRRFFWRLLSKCGVFHASWVGDVNQTLVNEGRRAIGMMFMDDLLEASPDAFLQMQREFKSNQKEE